MTIERLLQAEQKTRVMIPRNSGVLDDGTKESTTWDHITINSTKNRTIKKHLRAYLKAWGYPVYYHKIMLQELGLWYDVGR